MSTSTHIAPTPEQERILIIRLGALGDMILSTGCFKAIREHHPHAHITLMTAPIFAKLMQDCPYVDTIKVDAKPLFTKPYHIKAWLKTLAILHQPYTHVYDLQTSKRSAWYLRMLRSPKPMRSGIIEGCSHRHHTPERTSLHTLDRQRQQLNIAGIDTVYPPDISWMRSDISRLQLPDRYAVLATGGSAHRPEKRWTIEGFTALSLWLSEQGITPVFVGTGAESDVITAITQGLGIAPFINLCNQTSFNDIAELGRHAAFAIGNDTGPMHIIAATGTRSLVLFSHASNPALCAPRGSHIHILRRETLEKLLADDVIQTLIDGDILDSHTNAAYSNAK